MKTIREYIVVIGFFGLIVETVLAAGFIWILIDRYIHYLNLDTNGFLIATLGGMFIGRQLWDVAKICVTWDDKKPNVK